MITGIQVSSLRPLLTTPEEVTDTFMRFARMGCETVQLQWIDPAVSPEQIAKALTASKLTSVSVQDFYKDVIANLDYYTKLCTLTGSTWLCVSRIPEQYQNGSGLITFAKELDHLYDTIKPLGLKLCFHPTSPDYQLIDGTHLVAHLMNAVQCPLELCLDLYHIQVSGLSMTDLLHQFMGMVCMVHFKDYVTTPEGKVLVPAGQGEIDWISAISACLETNVAYGFVEQESWTKDPFVCMEEALNWLNEQLSINKQHC